MPSVRPFQFTGLPRFTRDQVALAASLSHYLGKRPTKPEFASDLAALLGQYLKVPCKLGVVERRSLTRRDLSTVVPQISCLVVVGASPGTQKIVCDIDQSLASFIIEKLLGGSGESDRIQRPLTEIEEGVLSFMLLKVLGQFHDGLSSGKELALTLDRFASKFDELSGLIDQENHFEMLGARVALGRLVGYVRVFIPGSLITEHFGKLVEQGNAPADERAYMLGLLESLGDTQVVGRVEAATIDLGPEDLKNLEVGDIVIVENHELKKTPDGIAGSVFIKLGKGKNGGLRGHVIDGEHTRIEIDKIVVQEEPQEDVMTDEGAGAEAGENLSETEGLLRDVPAPVVVELGRIRMNTAQVVRLKQGQILRLPRGANDPVDLVVHGKVFARGELIEVDGELGVRLVQVIGASE